MYVSERMSFNYVYNEHFYITTHAHNFLLEPFQSKIF